MLKVVVIVVMVMMGGRCVVGLVAKLGAGEFSTLAAGRGCTVQYVQSEYGTVQPAGQDTGERERVGG